MEASRDRQQIGAKAATETDWVALKVDTGRNEHEGDVACFEALLAPTFAMRPARGNDPYTDRDAFLIAVEPSAARPTKQVEVIHPTEKCTEVTCTVHAASDVTQKRFRNLRVFIRGDAAEPWNLLAWSNEEVREGEQPE